MRNRCLKNKNNKFFNNIYHTLSVNYLSLYTIAVRHIPDLHTERVKYKPGLCAIKEKHIPDTYKFTSNPYEDTDWRQVTNSNVLYRNYLPCYSDDVKSEN